MTKLLPGPKKEARKKGTVALASWVGTGVLAYAAPVWPLLLGGAALSGWFTLKWLRHRGKWGLRF